MTRKITRRDFLKGSAAGLASLAVSTSVLGLAKETAKAEGEIKVVAGTNLDPGTLEPTNSGGAKICWRDCVYESLAKRDGVGGELDLVLAKSYTQVDDYTYDIELYDYIKDTQGNPFTASDVVYCYEYYKTSGTVSKMGNLESMEALDDYTVRMVLTSTSVGVFEDMMMRPLCTQAAYEACGNAMTGTDTSCGTGPYYVSDFSESSFVKLTKKSDYWQTDESLIAPTSVANADEITIQTLGSVSQLAMAMEAGEIDGILYLSGEQAAYFVDDDGNALDGYFVETYLDLNAFQMYINMDSDYPSILNQSVELRKALFECFDAQDLLDGILDGRGELVYDWAGTAYPDYVESWSEDYFTYDPDDAMELLKASGYNGETIRLAAFNSSPYKDIAEAIQGYAGAIGIDIQLVLFDQTQQTTYQNDHSLWDVYLTGTLSSDYVVNCWTYLMDANNWGGKTAGGYDDEEFQNLLHTCMTQEGHTEENLSAFHYYMMDVAIGRGLFSQYYYSIWQDGVTSVYRNCNGYAMVNGFDFADDYSSNV